MRISAIFCTLGVLFGCSAATSPSARVDIAIGCNESTSAAQKISLPLTPQNPPGTLCLDRSTFVRGLEIANAKVWKDDKANAWWVIVTFGDSAASQVKSATSGALGRILGIVRGKKVIAWALITVVPNDSQYGFTTANEEEAHKLAEALR